MSISEILANITGIADSIGDLQLDNNDLTKVPDEIRLFNQLTSVELTGNKITSISSGAFDIQTESEAVKLYLDNNDALTEIKPGAFQGETELKLIFSNNFLG